MLIFDLCAIIKLSFHSPSLIPLIQEGETGLQAEIAALYIHLRATENFWHVILNKKLKVFLHETQSHAKEHKVFFQLHAKNSQSHVEKLIFHTQVGNFLPHFKAYEPKKKAQ